MASRLQDVILRGLAAAKPLATATAPGTLYYSTDTQTTQRSNGTIWETFNDAGAGGVALHAPTHAAAGADPVNITGLAGYTGGTTHFLRADATFSTVVATAGPHAASHSAGGGDAVTVTNLAGFPGTTTTFLRGDGTFVAPSAVAAAHATTHQPGGSDPMAVDAAAATGSLRTLGTSSTSAAAGNDSRLTDSRTPTAHATSHQPGGGDAMAVDAVAATGSLRTLGTGAQQATAGNDSRLTNSRTPTAHATTHSSGGSDAVTVTNLAGYPGGTTNFLRADGTFAAPPAGGGGITALTGDVTASGSGSVAATIAADAVTYAKMQNVSATARLLGRGSAGSGDPEELTVGAGLSFSGTVLNTVATTRTGVIEMIIDGGSSVITTGLKGFLEIPFACTITAVTLLADVSGSIVIDIWKDTYANYPPVVGDTITASAKPTITTAVKSQNTTLTGWTTSITAGDILGFNVDSVTTIKRVTLSLKVTI